jgi:hypothetical protein
MCGKYIRLRAHAANLAKDPAEHRSSPAFYLSYVFAWLDLFSFYMYSCVSSSCCSLIVVVLVGGIAVRLQRLLL